MKNKYKIFFLILLCTLSLPSFSQGSGRAYDFTSNYIIVPDATSFDTPTLTCEAWIKADAYAANIWENDIISKEGWATGDQGYALRCGASGSLSFVLGDGSGWHEAQAMNVMVANQWYHVAGTYDGTTIRLYVNGDEVGSTPWVGAISSTNYDLNIGRMSYTTGGTRYFDGMIDEVRIWNSALPQSSLRSYMCKKLDITHPQYFNLAAHYNMDAAGSVIDNASNGNHGTVIGSTHVFSGAAIGDESVFQYNVPANITLANGTSDSLTVNSTSILKTIHIYKVNGAPLNTALAASVDSIDQSHYYGIYTTATGAYTYTMQYAFGNNPLYVGQTYAALGSRVSGNAANWSSSGWTLNAPNQIFTAVFNARREVILGIDCPNIALTPLSAQNFCEGGSVTLTDNGAAVIRQWYNGAGLIPGATSNTLTVSNTGGYYLIANDGICTKTSPTVSVTSQPYPVANFGTLDTAFCDTEPIQVLSGSPTPGVFSGPGIFNSTFNPSMTGIGQFTLLYSVTTQYGCNDIDTLIVSVYDEPSAPTVSQTGTNLCVTAVSGLSYSWSLAGSPIAGATSNCYTALTNGNYTCTVTNVGGCSAISPNYVLDDLSVMENAISSQISLSPNPATEVVEVFSVNPAQLFTYKVYDGLGRQISWSSDAKANHKIEVSHLQHGMYFVHLYVEGINCVKALEVK